jgi:hypothetical protein
MAIGSENAELGQLRGIPMGKLPFAIWKKETSANLTYIVPDAYVVMSHLCELVL